MANDEQMTARASIEIHPDSMTVLLGSLCEQQRDEIARLRALMYAVCEADGCYAPEHFSETRRRSAIEAMKPEADRAQ